MEKIAQANSNLQPEVCLRESRRQSRSRSPVKAFSPSETTEKEPRLKVARVAQAPSDQALGSSKKEEGRFGAADKRFQKEMMKLKGKNNQLLPPKRPASAY